MTTKNFIPKSALQIFFFICCITLSNNNIRAEQAPSTTPTGLHEIFKTLELIAHEHQLPIASSITDIVARTEDKNPHASPAMIEQACIDAIIFLQDQAESINDQESKQLQEVLAEYIPHDTLPSPDSSATTTTKGSYFTRTDIIRASIGRFNRIVTGSEEVQGNLNVGGNLFVDGAIHSANGININLGTTHNAVQIGNTTGGLESLPIGTAGQVLTSNGPTLPPSFQNGDGGITTLTGDTGSTTGTTILVTGGVGNNITTAASGSQLTVKVAGTTDHAVQVGNATGSLTSLTVGTNGQVLIGSTGANPVFANLTSTNGSIQFTTGAGSLNLASTPVFGNVVRVDSVFGNNATGARNGLPFLTITAALAAALSGDAVWVFPGTYAESFTIPTGVSVVGLTTGVTIINTNVSIATDLVTMGESTRLENVTLKLTSSSHVQLRGVVFPGTTSATAKLRTLTLTVDNSTAGAGTSNVYGIHSNGTGTPGEETSAVRACTITVNSTGSGAKRGILVDTANDFHIRDTTISVTNSGGGSAIGVETNHASAAFTARTSTISGTNTFLATAAADISQTLGTITIVTTDLLNSNANNLGFSTAVAPSIIIWADVGALPAGTNFTKVGTSAPTANAMSVRCIEHLIVKSLSVRVRITPGSTDTWTVFKNGIATPLTVSLTTPALSNENNSVSVSFATGDSISLQIVRGLAGTQDPVVGMALY